MKTILFPFVRTSTVFVIFLAGCVGHMPSVDTYTSMGGKVWRQYNSGEITKEQYIEKMEMLQSLEDQWDQWQDVMLENLLKMTRSDWQEMRSYRARINRRMREIVEWDPDEDGGVSRADDRPDDIFDDPVFGGRGQTGLARNLQTGHESAHRGYPH